MNGTPLFIRTESNIDHSWKDGEMVADNLKSHNFSARYTTNFTAKYDGTINFEVEADDGYKLIVNDKTQIDEWSRNRWGASIYTLQTKKDSVYKIVVEYWQGEGQSQCKIESRKF